MRTLSEINRGEWGMQPRIHRKL